MKKRYKKYKSYRYEKRQKSNKRESKLLPLRYNSYTPLNTALINILIKIRDRYIVNWPGKLRDNPVIKDRKKYCPFHQDHGHNTKECKTLKDEIETLIKRSYLSKYKKKYRVEKLV